MIKHDITCICPVPRSWMVMFCGFFFLAAVVITSVGSAWAGDPHQGRWSLLSGYGQSYPDWGQTTQRVETIDLIPRYNHVVFPELGAGWYKGFHSTLFEFPVSMIRSPETSAMVGVNFLAAYTFTADKLYQPYMFGGGGPVYIFSDIPGMGTRLNGNYQFGTGIEYFLNHQQHLLFEVRYHHISNAGTAAPNEPLNSLKFIMGITF